MSIRVYVPSDTTACAVGADKVVQAIARHAELHGISIDIIRNGSRGAFWLETLVEVEADGERHAFGPVNPADVESLFAAGFPIIAASDPVKGAHTHDLYLGKTSEIQWLACQQRLTFKRAGLTDPLSIEDYKSHGGYEGLNNALKMTPSAIVDAVLASGLRGRGGAAFPTGIKWRTVLDTPAKQKYIACNADEGDSGTFADRLLMEADPFQLLEGMTISALAVGATQGYIYVRSEYPKAIQTLNRAIEIATAEKLLGDNIGDSGQAFRIEVRVGAGAYICGEETSMLESLEGKRGLVRFKPPLPAIEGLFGQPTVVNNVLTLAAVTTVLAQGADYYEQFGTGKSRGTLTAQLAGNIRRGGLVEIPFGMSLRELVENIGGGTASGRSVRAIQVGGPLGAFLPESQWDTPLNYEDFAAVGAMLGHGGIVVFDDSVNMLEMARFAMEFCAIESCGKCTPCRIGSVRGVEIIDQLKVRIASGSKVPELAGAGAGGGLASSVASSGAATANGSEGAIINSLNLLEELCETMEAGSLCAMGGLTPMPVRSAVKYFPQDFSVSEDAS